MLATRRTPGAGLTAGNDGSPPAERLAVVAHELRNPLAAVLYALEAMTDRGDDPASRQARAIAKRQVRRAVRLVNDLFDACAGTRGKLTVRREVVDIAGAVAGAVDAAAHLFAGSGHRLTVTLPPRPLAVFADPLRLEQVLANLLTNATKFTDPGGDIHLSVGTHAARVILRVRDKGRGIDPHLLPRVFDLFAQGTGPAGGARPGGLGIGLALVKSLIELHEGRVAAFSDGPGCGAEFVVDLPTCGCGRVPAADAPRPPATTRRKP